MDYPITADERRWRAESDARTLAEAKVIEKDQKRLADARAAAQRMADEQAKEAQAMRTVAGQKKSSNTGNKAAKKSTSKAKGSNSFNVMSRI